VTLGQALMADPRYDDHQYAMSVEEDPDATREELLEALEFMRQVGDGLGERVVRERLARLDDPAALAAEAAALAEEIAWFEQQLAFAQAVGDLMAVEIIRERLNAPTSA